MSESWTWGQQIILMISTSTIIIDFMIDREVDWVNSGGEDIPLEQPSPTLKPENWALV